MKICQNCNHENKDANKFCVKCGTKLEDILHSCPKCGCKLEGLSKFSPECGTALSEKKSLSNNEKQDSIYNELEKLTCTELAKIYNTNTKAERDNEIGSDSFIYEINWSANKRAIFNILKNRTMKVLLDEQVWTHDADLQGWIGICYYFGFCCDKDEEKALTWFHKAAEQGHTGAMNMLGICYNYRTSGDYEKNKRKCTEYFKKTSELGSINAKFNLAYQKKSAYNDSEREEAFELYKELSDQGELYADFQLYLCFKDGIGCGQNLTEAFYCIEHLAKNNSAFAYYELCNSYTFGEGCIQDEDMAMECRIKAADLGHYIAAKELIKGYYSGRNGYPLNYKEAFRLCKEFDEEDGDPEIKILFANMYRRGLAGEKMKQRLFICTKRLLKVIRKHLKTQWN
ncbi:hypothetical protein E4N85_07690 [Treponema denticola]|uniref:tetratricopeptide repeat protein n=1 Tax=Treponema denticola TaxID=158 RepID=UPI0020A469B4|nr:zinc ribbon domain-containing protein [Treponema denticola]UTC95613.1 hypothetical protein E4N85_07690 [Treponema denticola]